MLVVCTNPDKPDTRTGFSLLLERVF